ncbi:MAG: hypothetical protein HYT13_00765 [Candidatus Liptonbacteria bacterium]|nr:hypothetical protein [Candidatus Liptonbacteria bacterium]
MGNFLEKLQSSDERIKRRWLIGLTAIVVVGVVYVWLAYFNNLLAGFNAPPQEISQPKGSFSFLATLKRGAAVIYDVFSEKLQVFGKILEKPREYIIQPPK